MPETRRKYDPEFKEGAVRIVWETGKPIAQIARDLGIHAGTLGNWVAKDRAEREGTEGLSMGDAAELKRLRAENAQLRMERDVLKRSVVLWVLSRTRDNTQGTAWSGDYRLRPWYRTRRAAAAFAGAAAAIVAVGILLAAHTPSDRHQQPTIVAPQVSTTQPTPHTTAQTSMSTPPPPPAAPPPPPPPAPPPQDAPAPTWRNSVPRQTTPSDDEPPRINVSRPPISVAPKPVTPPVTAAPGQNRRGGWGW